MLADEEELLLYIVHVGVTLQRAPGTVKQRLFSIRQMQIVAGFVDPLAGKRRLWMAVKGLTRRWGGSRRKLPTTPAMLRWIRRQLSPETKPDDAVLWAALVTAFFFLMRIGEYAYSNGWAMARVLTPADLRPQKEGQQVELFRDADEVMLRFKTSKA